MRQQSFTAEDFEKYRKKTRKEVFLEEMDQIIPWQEMGEAVKPYYPGPKGAGIIYICIGADLVRLPR
jgi:IS5 family transposase